MGINTNGKKQLPNKQERHKLFGSVEPGKKTKPTDKEAMADLQNSQNNYLFDLDAVGISNVKYPVKVSSQLQPTTQSSIGEFSFSSTVAKDSKGTNMSRFTEQLHAYLIDGNFDVSLSNLKEFTKELAVRLKRNDAFLEVTFPWFFERKGPSSDLSGFNHADAYIRINYDKELGYDIITGITGTITTLCPCSKEISEYSAHNQRGKVSMEIALADSFDENKIDWKQALLEAAESNASARIHPVLKRPDEKMVTEQAYENPRFVEDMVRLVAADLYEMEFVQAFHVVCQNEESIHLHDAIASITYDKSEE
ncbi:GTP cyclohydrolase FolE2 [Paraliobacillus ryukyuensis]|uniref:GTP cyclohydrolase FolE2 n=1 Tax=Paraliobacillus ryukyuensis TaxID=200904 RepID=UPI0009A8F64D|nr:GTP cyclohydrolase FolE2 [Paraliobacillus ryukyuensis]